MIRPGVSGCAVLGFLRIQTPSMGEKRAATNHDAIGWPEAGRIEPGAPADLVALSLDSVRLAGAEPETVLESAVFAATAADVRDVIACGRQVVRDGRHTAIDVPGELRTSIAAVLPHGVAAA